MTWSGARTVSLQRHAEPRTRRLAHIGLARATHIGTLDGVNVQATAHRPQHQPTA
jgi:hypothetical protein